MSAQSCQAGILKMPSGAFGYHQLVHRFVVKALLFVSKLGRFAGLRQDSDVWIRRYEDSKQMADDALAQIQVVLARGKAIPSDNAHI